MKLPMLPGQQVPVEPRAMPLANPGAASLAPAELGEEAERDTRMLYFTAREAVLQQRQEAERDAAMAGAKVVAQARNDLSAQFQQAQQNAGPGAPNFTTDFQKNFDAYSANALKQTPAAAQPYVSQRLDMMRAAMSDQAMGFEAKALNAKRESDLQSTVDLSANTVRSDPSQYEHVLGDVVGAVHASGIAAARLPGAESYASGAVTRSMIEGLNERDPAAAQKLLDGGTLDANLTPQVKNELLNGNQQALDRQQAESERQQHANQIELQGSVQALYSDERAQIRDRGYGQGLLTPEMINQAYPAARYGALAQRMISGIDRDKADYTSMQKMALTSPAEDHALLAKMAPAGSDYAAQVENRNRAEALVTKKYATIAADPAGYAFQNNPDVQQSWSAAANDPSKIASAIALSQATQAKLGVPPDQQRVLSVPQAQAAAGRLASAAPDAAGQMLQDLAHQYGGQWTTVFGEIAKAGLPSAYQDLASIDDPAARTAFAQALKAGPKLPELLAPGDKKTIDGAVEDALQPFLRTFSPAGSARAASLQQSAKTLAYLYASRGQSANDAANAAVRGMSGQYDIADGPDFNARAPKGMLAPIEGYADHLLAGLKGADLKPPPAGPHDVPLTDDQRAAAYFRDGVQHGSTWITNPSDDGWQLLDQQQRPVLKADGTPLGFKFSDVAALPTPQIPATAEAATGAQAVPP